MGCQIKEWKFIYIKMTKWINKQKIYLILNVDPFTNRWELIHNNIASRHKRIITKMIALITSNIRFNLGTREKSFKATIQNCAI